MSNTGIKKILFTVISVLIVATVVAVSFAVWDNKTSNNNFSAVGGDRIEVSVAGSSSFNTTLIPDGVVNWNNDKSALYIYVKFTPTLTNPANKNVSLRWEFQKFNLGATNMLKTSSTTELQDESLLEGWVSTVATLDKPSDAIKPGTGTLVSGTDYYFVVKFRMFKYKEYTHSNNTNYTFYSNGTYKVAKYSDVGTLQPINATILSNLGITYNSSFTFYQNAPYQSEHIDTAKYLDGNVVGKAITTELRIYGVEA